MRILTTTTMTMTITTTMTTNREDGHGAPRGVYHDGGGVHHDGEGVHHDDGGGRHDEERGGSDDATKSHTMATWSNLESTPLKILGSTPATKRKGKKYLIFGAKKELIKT